MGEWRQRTTNEEARLQKIPLSLFRAGKLHLLADSVNTKFLLMRVVLTWGTVPTKH